MTTPMPYPADTDEASGSKAFRDSTVAADANFSSLAVNFNAALATCTRLMKVTVSPLFTPVAGVTVNAAYGWQFGGEGGSRDSGYVSYLYLMLTIPGSMAFNAKLGSYATTQNNSLPGVREVLTTWTGFRATGGASYSMCAILLGSINNPADVYWGGLTTPSVANPAGSFAIGITFQAGRTIVAPA